MRDLPLFDLPPTPPTPPRPPVVDTLKQERERLELVRLDCREETHCRACDQLVRTYRFKFHRTMAHGLIRMVKQFERTNDWVHVPTLEKATPSVPCPCLTVAARWELIEKHPTHIPDKRASGLWRPTERGIDFVYDRIRIPSHVYLSDETVRGFETQEVSIVQALGEKFDYRELMNGY